MGLVVPPLLAGAAAFAVTYFDPLGTIKATNEPEEPAVPSGTRPDGAEDIAAPEDSEVVAEEAGPPPPPKMPSLLDPEAKSAKKKKGKDGDPPATVLLELEPIVVSLMDVEGERRAPRLRIAIAVEGLESHLAAGEVVTIKLRDGFTAALREMPPAEIGQANGLDRVRAHLLEEAGAVLGSGAVSQILITDFLMT